MWYKFSQQSEDVFNNGSSTPSNFFGLDPRIIKEYHRDNKDPKNDPKFGPGKDSNLIYMIGYMQSAYDRLFNGPVKDNKIATERAIWAFKHFIYNEIGFNKNDPKDSNIVNNAIKTFVIDKGLDMDSIDVDPKTNYSVFNSNLEKVQKYDSLIATYASQYGIDPNLIRAVITKESDWNPNDISPMNKNGTIDYGLMQTNSDVIKDWNRLGKLPHIDTNNILDPEINLNIGCWELKGCLDYVGGDTTKALIAYNAGKGNVNSPPLSTIKYSQDIMRMYQQSTEQGNTEDSSSIQPNISGNRPITREEKREALADLVRQAKARFGDFKVDQWSAPRLQQGSTKLSLHTWGLAMDWYGGLKNQALANWAVTYPNIQTVIFNRKIWSPYKGWHDYRTSGDPHTDHVHVDFGDK